MALPFGLTWADLSGVLEPQPVEDGCVIVSHVTRGRHQGGHPSVIVTLSYEASGGEVAERTLFFKLNPDASREAPRYRFLADHGVPVPQLVVCVERPGDEVLGLQFLPSIGLYPADVDDVHGLTAALNSRTEVPAGIGRTPPGLPQAQFEGRLSKVLAGLDRRHPEHEAATWFDIYRRAAVAYRGLPKALTHGELAAQQLGRTRDGTLVVFDLATVGLRARFADIANLLPTLTKLSGRDERSLFEDYLGHLAEGHEALLGEQVWPELRLTRFTQAMEALPWHLGVDEGEPALDQRLQAMAADAEAVQTALSARPS